MPSICIKSSSIYDLDSSLTRHGFLLILNNLLYSRALHKSLVPSIVIRVVLLDLELVGLVSKNPWHKHIPRHE